LPRLIALFLFGLCAAAHAEQAFSFQWVTYAQGERLPALARATYLGGAFDSLTGFTATDVEMRMAIHYSSCMSKSGMNLQQFADHVLAFAQARPDLQGTTFPLPEMGYFHKKISS
jgi:hypothetical protein